MKIEKKTFSYYPYFAQSNWNQKSKQVNRKNSELSIQSFCIMRLQQKQNLLITVHCSCYIEICAKITEIINVYGEKNSRPHRQLFTCLISIITLIRAMETNILSIRPLSDDFSLKYATTVELWKWRTFFCRGQGAKRSICREKGEMCRKNKWKYRKTEYRPTAFGSVCALICMTFFYENCSKRIKGTPVIMIYDLISDIQIYYTYNSD